MNILVVQSDGDSLASIKGGLKKTGYKIDTAANGEDAVYLASINNYDIIILDTILPKISGIDVCRILRREKNRVYILFLSSEGAVEDKVRGLDSGADDYMVKPFDFSELLARIRAILRRDSNDKENIITAKDLKVNLLNREVSRSGKDIDLTLKEFNLLEYFIRNKNLVLTRAMIAEKVWDIDFLSDTNVVDVYINHLRKKIDKGYSEKLIHTVRGVGYIMKV